MESTANKDAACDEGADEEVTISPELQQKLDAIAGEGEPERRLRRQLFLGLIGFVVGAALAVLLALLA